MSNKYQFDTIFHDGNSGYKVARLGIPENCTAVRDNQKIYALRYELNKKNQHDQIEYDAKSDDFTELKFNNLINFKGLVLPDKMNVPLSWFNGRNLRNIEAIFTRDRRIFLSSAFNEATLENAIERVVSIFSLDRWQTYFESHVNPRRIL